MINEILNNSELKPYQKTSYFLLMIAVVIGGAGLILATSIYLPNVAFLTDAQRGQILETMFQGWGALSGIVVGGNVAARGGVTLLKQWLQNKIAENATAPKVPETVAAAGDVAVGSTPAASVPAAARPDAAIPEAVEWREPMPGDVPQGKTPRAVPELKVEPLPAVADTPDDPTIPRADAPDLAIAGGDDYERVAG